MAHIRTAILGGSFNPIHKGHIALARHILHQGLADEVWLLVSPQNPLKNNSALLPEGLRLRLAQIAVANESQIKASDFEFHLSRPSYTWNTLCALTQEYPERDFMLTIGADNWLIFDQWAHHDEIRANYPIIVYPREGYSIDPSSLPDSVHYLDSPLYPYSSTEIRAALKTLHEMTDQEVLTALLEGQSHTLLSEKKQ